MPNSKTFAKFMAHVSPEPNTGCWLWTGVVDRKGYGKYGSTGTQAAHRWAWFFATGKLPPPEMMVCHRCDVPACVNPMHLFLGTAKDNLGDMAKKDRSCHGSKQHASKLIEADVVEIKRALVAGEPFAQIAERFGVKCITINKISRNETWARIPWPRDQPISFRKSGDAHHNVKISDADVGLLLADIGTRQFTQRQLAAKYGISKSLVGAIAQGKCRARGGVAA